MNIKYFATLSLVALALAFSSVAPAQAWHYHRYYSAPVVTNYGYPTVVPAPLYGHRHFWR